MKRICRLLVLAAALSAASSQGMLFNYSYTFASGGIVSGSLEGDQTGLHVVNIANVTMAFNGNPVAGNILGYQHDGDNYAFVPGPVVSFDALLNNFRFETEDLTHFFMMVSPPNYHLTMAEAGFGEDFYGVDTLENGRYESDRWSLTP